MKISVDLNTGLIVEGYSESDDATLIENAQRRGFTNVEVREVSDAEHRALIAARDVASKTPAMRLLEKDAVLTQAKELRDKIFARLNGIQLDYTITGNNPTGVAAIAAAKVGLRDITTHATVIAATDGAETTAALKTQYDVLVAALYAAEANHYACTAFNGLDV